MAHTITVTTRRGALTFPLDREGAEAMSSGELRSLLTLQDPNGEWHRPTTLIFSCPASCEGMTYGDCKSCDGGEGHIVRDARDGEEYDQRDVLEPGCDREDLIAAAIDFGVEILADSGA